MMLGRAETFEPMASKRKPDQIVNLKVRFSEALRSRIEEEAKRNYRSLNGEIVHRLATTFGAEGAAIVHQYEEEEKRLSKHLREIVDRMIAEGKKKS
jgi:hypothetical protein